MSGSTSNGSSVSGTSNAGAPLKELPQQNTSSNNDKKTDLSEGGSQASQQAAESQADQNGAGSSQSGSNDAGSGELASSDAGNGQAAQNGAGDSQQVRKDTDSGQAVQSGTDGAQPIRDETGDSQSVIKTAGKDSGTRTAREKVDEEEETGSDSQTKVTEGEPEPEESVSKPVVTMVMEDTTILLPEDLQAAKEQNLDLQLKMGKYATWSIDIDSVDMDMISEVDMGIELGTENIPTQIIADILDGNKYLEFTLAHDGLFGFSPLLQIAIDPMYEGWYANLFYYNEEAESLEFICDVIIDSDGIASFDMEHASSYVIIVSPVSMAGMTAADNAFTGDSGSPAMRWVVTVVSVCVIAAGIGCGIFFYRRKFKEDAEDESYDETGDAEENDETEEKYEESEEEECEEPEEEYDESGEEEYDEPEEEYEEPGEEVSVETEEERREKSTEEPYGHSAEDDWIEDEDWQEPEMPEVTSDDKFADDHAEDDWIDDDEWDIGNDWIDDEEWARRKEA